MTRFALLAGTACACLPGLAVAAGIERAAPSTRVLFEDGRYLEFSFSSVSPDLSGSGGFVAGPTPAAPNGTGDLFESYLSFGFAYKADLNDRLSYAVIVDDSVGVDTQYPTVAGSIYSGTVAELNGIQVTGILAYDVSDRVKVYGGIRAQAIDANADLPFIGAPAGYTVDAERDWSAGYLVGAAYQIPEIALRVALTYYSAIDHELASSEAVTGVTSLDGTVEISTPQSVNLEFQTGIAEDTLLFGGIRWVDWSEFAIAPPLFSSPAVANQPLVDYQEDWVTYTLGVGRRFSETWSGAVQVSWEPAADYTPLTTLGPVDGRRSLSLAATYTEGPMKITTGVTYVKLGETSNFAGTNFSGGDAVGVGLRVGYTF